MVCNKAPAEPGLPGALLLFRLYDMSGNGDSGLEGGNDPGRR